MARVILGCLIELGVSQEAITGKPDLPSEWVVIKRAYFSKVLATHPDKGGDPSLFRAAQEAWEVVRALYDQDRIPGTFLHYFKDKGRAEAAPPPAGGAGAGAGGGGAGAVPSYDWFTAAAAEEVPPYCVERAKSGRSKCTSKGIACHHKEGEEEIAKGELRWGSMDKEAGAYARFHHLRCWRVPAIVHLRLPKQGADAALFHQAMEAMQSLTFVGWQGLSAEEQAQIVEHVMNPAHYARVTKATPAVPAFGAAAGAALGDAAGAGAGAGGGGGASASASSALALPPPAKARPASDALVAAPRSGAGAGGSLTLPRPGVDGIPSSLAGHTFVLTGTFPEVGGGAGLNLGKDRLTGMISSFGGRVTGSVSGATSYLVVGQAPGGSKVGQATARGVPMVDVKAVVEQCKGAGRLGDAPAPTISSYSAGYGGNGYGRALGAGEVKLPKYLMGGGGGKKKAKTAAAAAASAAAAAAAAEGTALSAELAPAPAPAKAPKAPKARKLKAPKGPKGAAAAAAAASAAAATAAAPAAAAAAPKVAGGKRKRGTPVPVPALAAMEVEPAAELALAVAPAKAPAKKRARKAAAAE